MGAGASQDSGKQAQPSQRSSDSQPTNSAGGGGAAAGPTTTSAAPAAASQSTQQQQQQPQAQPQPAAAKPASSAPAATTTTTTTTSDMSEVQTGSVARDGLAQQHAGAAAKVSAIAAFQNAGQKAQQQPGGKTQDELDEEEWAREKEKISQRFRERQKQMQAEQQSGPAGGGGGATASAPSNNGGGGAISPTDKPPAGPTPAGGSGGVAPPAAGEPKKKRLLNGTDIEHRYPSGSVYHGGFKDGKLHGYGVYKYHPSGDVYEGEWVADMKHGHGSYRYDCGDTYTGEWRAGKKHGKGTYRFTSGDEYVGNWKEDKIHGHGVFHIARNGNTYEGNWVESYRHGYGVLHCGNGDIYYGNWAKGKEEGPGVLVYANQNLYAGDWKAGQMDGKGILVEDGQKFTVEHIGSYLIAKVPVEKEGAVDPDWNPANQLYMQHLAKMQNETAADGTRAAAGGISGEAADIIAKLTSERDSWQRRYQDLLASKGGGDAIGQDDDGLNLNDHNAVRARLAELRNQRDLQQRRADENEQRVRNAEAQIKEIEFEVKRLQDEAVALKAVPAASGDGAANKAEMDKMQRRVADLERELNARKQGSAVTGSKDSNDPVQLKAQLELLEGEVRHLRSNREELQKIREQHLDAQRTIMSLELKHEELLKEINIQRQRASYASTEVNEDSQRQIAALRDEVKDLRQELQDTKVAALSNEQLLKKQKQKLKEAEDKAQRAAELEMQVLQLKSAKSSQSALSDKRSDELESLRQKNAELMRQLEEMQAEGPASHGAGGSSAAPSAASQAQLQELAAKNEALAADMKKDKKKAKKVAAERDELAIKVAAAQADAARASRAVSAIHGRVVSVVRVRGVIPAEAGKKGSAVEVSGDAASIAGQQFSGFDLCVPSDAPSDAAVVDELRPTARAVAQGYNACIMMLGPMSSGKTTACSALANALLPEVFRSVDEATKPKGAASAYTPSYQATCVEVTCDGVFDLNNSGSTGFDLKPMKDTFGTVVTDGAIYVPLQLARDAVVDFIGAAGRRQRRRSHFIYTLHVTLRHKVSDASIRGKLVIADLAGAGSLGEQSDADSAKYVNKSVMALHNVISALSENQTGVPYRDDALTLLLADALGGNCRLATVTVLPPVADDPEAIAQALSVASRLARVDCRPQRQLETAETQRLRQLVEQLQSPEAAKPPLMDIDSVRD